MYCLITLIQYVQYVALGEDPSKVKPHTHCADQSSIFYSCHPIREVLLVLSIGQKTTKFISATHEKEECLNLHVIQMLKRRTQKMEMPGASSH